MPYIKIEIEGFLPSPDCVLHLVVRSTIKPSQCAKDEDVLLHPQPPMKTRPRGHGNQTNTALAMMKMIEGVYVTTLAWGKNENLRQRLGHYRTTARMYNLHDTLVNGFCSKMRLGHAPILALPAAPDSAHPRQCPIVDALSVSRSGRPRQAADHENWEH